MRRIAQFISILLLCSSFSAEAGFRLFERRKPAPRPAPVETIDQVAVDTLYADLAQATSDYQAGLELERSGQPRAAEARTQAALKLMEEANAGCVKTPGCEPARFITGWQTLLKLRSLENGATLAEVDADPALSEVQVAEAAEPAAPKVRAVSRAYVRLDSKLLKARITLNEPVRAAINDWLTWMRPQLIETWTNYQFMRELMWPRYEESGLPEALLFAILAKESVGRVHAYSRAGAAGPLQFMPDTARRYGLKVGGGEDERLDPKAATGANVAYLIDQLSLHRNSVELALAAYNGGEGRVRRLMEKHPDKAFWSDEVYYALPAETRDYVPKVLAAAYLFLHPEEFNLKFPALPGALTELQLEAPASLNELAICLGQDGRTDGWFRTLRNLNPRLKTDERLPVASSLRVPRAVLPAYATHCRNERFMARIATVQEARYPTGARYVAYTVRRGDTLSSIARSSSCTSIGRLAELNQIAPPHYALKPGQLLKLPTCS